MTLRHISHWLARPALLHWLLPYLMSLVIAGTVAEKYIGLYDSQRLFFSSFVIWIGSFPLPGGRTATALLLICLLAKLIVASPWHKGTAGIFVAHLGVALLLLGGLLTAAFSTEGYMVLNKNESASQFSDYHRRVLTISKNGKALLQLPLENIVKGEVIRDPRLPFTLTIHEWCRNCTMAMRQDEGKEFKGVAGKVKLSPLAGYLEDERNLAGVEFTVAGAREEDNGTYIAFEPMEKQPVIAAGADHYTVTLGRQAYPLPFTLQLLDAEKDMHPGTDVVRGYRSTVLIADGPLRQRAVITMNYPLRYKGYTVYQSSFNGGDNTQSVSFAVVQNSGRVFPYVASLTLCIGLLIHLSLRLPALFRRKSHAL